MLDYVSTYVVLELSGKTYLRGRSACQLGPADGRVYKLVLGRHGCCERSLTGSYHCPIFHFKFGFKGFGQTAFVIVLVPYAVVTMAAIFNNIVLTFV